VIHSAVFADLRRGALSRFCAIYFVASILVPTMAPFRTVSFTDLVRASISPSGRIAPSGIATRDTALVAASSRHLNRRLKTRLRVIADADQTARRLVASFTKGTPTPSAGIDAHRKPPAILRI
jgi:hypothetical protein